MSAFIFPINRYICARIKFIDVRTCLVSPADAVNWFYH